MHAHTLLRRSLVGLLLAGLIAPALASAGIVHAQCTGDSTTVECIGVDPDGWDAAVAAPGAATTITIQPGSQVQGPIALEGDDTLAIATGGELAVITPAISGAIEGVHATNDQNTITIDGALTLSGGGQAEGVVVEGDQNTVTLDGSLSVTDSVVRARGINAEGDQNTITINGTLHAAGEGFHHVTYGARAGGTNGQIINTGSVTTECTGEECSSAGLILAGNRGQLLNSGSITSTATTTTSHVFGAAGISVSANDALVLNSGSIYAASGPGSGAAEGISLSGANGRIINTGTLTTASDNVNSAVAMYGPGGQLVNTGTITSSGSAVYGGMESQSVNNSGTLNGAVFLGRGDDSFTAEGGAVNGTLDGGDDFDTLTFALDVLDVDYPALAALIATASPAGGSLSYGGATYTWINFEQLINLLNIVASNGGGEVIVSTGGIDDGRLNRLHPAATAIVYPLADGGVELYTPQGDLALRAEADAIIAALTQAESSGVPVEINARLGLALLAQPDGSLLATGPDDYTFLFQPDQCGIDR